MAPMNRLTDWLGRLRTKPARRPPGSAPSSDFADYGTAFGLDLSLSPASLSKDSPVSSPAGRAETAPNTSLKPR
jgi:hypothetical protein